MLKKYLFVLNLLLITAGTSFAAIQSDPADLNVIVVDKKIIEMQGQQESDDFLSLEGYSDADEWQQCADSEFGIKFECKTSWRWKRLKDSIMIVISEEPTVTLTITRLDPAFHYLEQISQRNLVDLNLYADGFITEKVDFAGQKAVKVKAFSRKYPEIRLSDYYFIHNTALYGTLFSIYPKEQWEGQQRLIERIKDSFSFMTDSDYL